MDFHDLLAAVYIRPVDIHLAIKPPRPEQRRVEHVSTVGRGDDNNVGIVVKTIHLDQNLVEGLLALVMAAAKPGATHPPYRVDLIDEHDARRDLLGLFKQIADPACAHADEHLDELRA